MQIVSTGRFETSNASKYLQQLCKHFSHKLEVSYDETTGEIALPTGGCRLHADPDALRVHLDAADAVAMQRARGIIDSHLARFAFREDFSAMKWS